MGLPRQARNIRRMVAGLVSRQWITNQRIRTAEKLEKVGDYLIEHKSGDTHRSTDPCELCAEHAKNAVPRFEAGEVKSVFVRHGGNNGIDLHDSVLCDLCSNASRGVRLPGRSICFDCASDDPELVKEIIRIAIPEISEKLETTIKEAGIK